MKYDEDGVSYIKDPTNEEAERIITVLAKYSEFVLHCLDHARGCDVTTHEGRIDTVTCIGAAAYASTYLSQHLVTTYERNLEQLPEDERDKFDREISQGVQDGLAKVTALVKLACEAEDSSGGGLPDPNANLQ